MSLYVGQGMLTFFHFHAVLFFYRCAYTEFDVHNVFKQHIKKFIAIFKIHYQGNQIQNSNLLHTPMPALSLIPFMMATTTSSALA